MADDIKRGRAARNARLASIPVGMAGRAALGAAKRLTGKSKDEVNAELMEKAANQLFSVLGELKGGAMKVGQALSVLEAAIPEEFGEPYREALTKLQKDAPPLPAAKSLTGSLLLLLPPLLQGTGNRQPLLQRLIGCHLAEQARLLGS